MGVLLGVRAQEQNFPGPGSPSPPARLAACSLELGSHFPSPPLTTGAAGQRLRPSRHTPAAAATSSRKLLIRRRHSLVRSGRWPLRWQGPACP